MIQYSLHILINRFLAFPPLPVVRPDPQTTSPSIQSRLPCKFVRRKRTDGRRQARLPLLPGLFRRRVLPQHFLVESLLWGLTPLSVLGVSPELPTDCVGHLISSRSSLRPTMTVIYESRPNSNNRILSGSISRAPLANTRSAVYT